MQINLRNIYITGEVITAVKDNDLNTRTTKYVIGDKVLVTNEKDNLFGKIGRVIGDKVIGSRTKNPIYLYEVDFGDYVFCYFGLNLEKIDEYDINYTEDVEAMENLMNNGYKNINSTNKRANKSFFSYHWRKWVWRKEINRIHTLIANAAASMSKY